MKDMNYDWEQKFNINLKDKFKSTFYFDDDIMNSRDNEMVDSNIEEEI
eukprot:CAMPEP_0116904396 /NCGR_PEP_ID=MMETSP0467-20121206/11403_1 /TAXON_ID=283647 /ORGANISM="Mesodinium pulex, Strain SPMC105" /LENGTH=47 /DNA_ID= /DNA_START= /DNA_END= /DNA_ORIENTATION=